MLGESIGGQSLKLGRSILDMVTRSGGRSIGVARANCVSDCP
jgi:hypothetical protein